jgi:hypothetical protein
MPEHEADICSQVSKKAEAQRSDMQSINFSALSQLHMLSYSQWQCAAIVSIGSMMRPEAVVPLLVILSTTAARATGISSDSKLLWKLSVPARRRTVPEARDDRRLAMKKTSHGTLLRELHIIWSAYG